MGTSSRTRCSCCCLPQPRTCFFVVFLFSHHYIPRQTIHQTLPCFLLIKPFLSPSRTTVFDNVSQTVMLGILCMPITCVLSVDVIHRNGTTLFGLLAGDRIDTHSTKQQCSVHCKRRIPSIGRDHLFIIFFNIEIRFLFLFTADTFYLQDLV